MAESNVTGLTAVLDEARTIDLDLVDIGVPSGMQITALPLLDDRPGQISFRAIVPGEPDYTFEISVPPPRTIEERKAELGLGLEDDAIFVTTDLPDLEYAPVELSDE